VGGCETDSRVKSMAPGERENHAFADRLYGHGILAALLWDFDVIRAARHAADFFAKGEK
jgi:hypothetical protein